MKTESIDIPSRKTCIPRCPVALHAPQSTVIVLDEDCHARDVACAALCAAGHRVQPFATVPALLASTLPADASLCIVLEARFEAVCGLEVQQELASRPRRPQLVFLTGIDHVPTAVKAMHAGAVDFLLKPARSDELVAAVRLGLERDRSRLMADVACEETRRRLDGLTPRERQVMALVTSGRLNKQIAYDLSISLATVKMHRGQVMRKLGVRSVAELTRLGQRLEGEAGAAPTRPVPPASREWLKSA